MGIPRSRPMRPRSSSRTRGPTTSRSAPRSSPRQGLAMSDVPALALEDVTCRFAARGGGEPYTAVANTTLRVAAGEFVSVVGPTGCGKSTLLNVSAGLLEPSAGTVSLVGEMLPASQGVNRRAGYMFQMDALMPWRTGIDNVIAGLDFRGVARAEARQQGEAWF